MTFRRLTLGPRLSAVSWFFIEVFALIAVFFLPFSKSTAEAAITVSLVLWALRKLPWNERFSSPFPCTPSYLIFLFFVALSLYQIPRDHLWEGFHGFVKWLQYLAIFFMATEWLEHKKRRERFLGIFIFSTALLCVNGFVQLWAGHDLVKGYTADLPGRFTRMQSSLSSSNDLAAFLLLGLPLIFFLWLNESKWSPKSFLLALTLLLGGLSFILTLSRSGFLALLLAVTVFALVTGRKKAFVPLAAGLGLLFLSKALRYNFLGSLNFRDITIGERLRFWHLSWKMILEHPFLGGGVNTFYQRFAAMAPPDELYRGYAHNCYLQMWSEVGLAGLAAFLAPPVFILSRGIFRAAREKASFGLEHALWIGILSFFVQSFFDTNFYALQTAMIFWIFWGFLASSVKTEAI
ncbi:MAG: O-antigen ligase family protein [Candidatus Omnitrophota bacterium]